MKHASSIFALLFLTACSGCSSSPATTDGGTGGACMNLAICTVIPSATVNSLTGYTTTGATPTMTTTPVGDECLYSTAMPGADVRITRLCNMNAKLSYEADSMQTLGMGGMRSAVAGVGDAATYQTEPAGTTSKATLFSYKGTALMKITVTGVMPAQDAMVKAGMISMAMTLSK
jgi:hypothetical protein